MPKFSKEYYAYVDNYKRENYDQIRLLVPKGFRDTIREHASARGESNNAFIARAIREQMKRDLEADAISAPNPD
jgi:hypothetical protein